MATRLHADEVPIDDRLVRALLADQAPAWAGLPLRRVASTGTDNAIYRLGDDLGVRLPRVPRAARQVDHELEWLPRLAPDLPVAVPEPLLRGEPGHGYPLPWLVFRWLPGDDALAAGVERWDGLALDVATFVRALRSLDTAGAPPPAVRGAPQAARDDATRRWLARLDDPTDRARALAVWEAALDAGPWEAPPVWVHGDLLPGNLLVAGDRLRGIVDWSGVGAGDPAADLMVAWAMPPHARAAFREAVGADDGTWARARGWVVEQAASFVVYYAGTIPDGVAAARRRLDAALSLP